MPRTVEEAIRAAEAVLPGRMARGDEFDLRRQVMFDLKDFIESDPEPLWEFAARWGRHRSEDIRLAVACVLLEHLLPPHFDRLFPRVRELALGDPRFAFTLRICGREWFQPKDRRRLVRLARQAERLHSD